MTVPPPPGPRGLERLLALPRFGRDPLAFTVEITRRHGDVARVQLGRDAAVLVGDPALVGEVLLDREHRFHKDRVTRGLSVIVGNGLLTSEGDFWRRQRRLIAPPLQRKHIARYADAMAASAAALVDRWRDGEARDLHRDMMRLTLDIVVETLFGLQVGDVADRVDRTVEGFMRDFQLLVQTWRRLLPHDFPQPVRRRMRAAGRVLDDILLEIIRTKRAAAGGDDLLSLLLAARDDAGTGMTDAQLRDEAATLFLAGHETTALALGYAFVALARDPAVEAWLHEELDAALGDRLPGADDVARLPRTCAVVDETLRLFPPAWMIGREPQADVVMGGFRVSRGDQVLIAPWAMHRDPRWFDDPLVFRPARWLDGLAERLPRFAYLPFGGGARVCIGNHFARMEAVLLLATIARRVRLEAPPGWRLRLAPTVTLRPRDGLPVVVRRR